MKFTYFFPLSVVAFYYIYTTGDHLIFLISYSVSYVPLCPLSFFFFLWYLGLTQGLMFARQEFYHLSHLPTKPFCFTYFLDRVTSFCPELASNSDPPPHVLVAGIAGSSHHGQLTCWDVSCWLSQLVGLQLQSSQISASLVAGMTSMHHHSLSFLMLPTLK
jgi:hypothetical protein